MSSKKVKRSIVRRLIASQRLRDLLKPIIRPFLNLFLFPIRNIKLNKIISSYGSRKNSSASHKINLIVSMTYLKMGGVERVMLNILKGLGRDRFNITILTTVRTSHDWEEAFVPFVDKIIHVPELFDITWPLKYHSRFIELYAKKIKADILFITNSETAYWATKNIKKLNPTTRIYDLLHTHGTKIDNDAYLKISMPFDEYIDKRIVIDEYLKDYYCNKYPVDENKVFVIYNGLDKSKVINLDSKKDKLMARIDKRKKIISYVGRLDSDKSPIRLVDIAIKINENKLPIVINVVGDGTLRKDMEKKAQKNKILNKTIYFYGRTDKPEQIISKSDFTILVSDNEGIPMSVLESMDLAIPPIAPAVGGIPEIISDKTDGFLVDINSKKNETEKIQAFFEAIVEANNLSDSEYINMKNLSKKKIKNKFRKMAEIYRHLFETDEIL